MKIEEKEKRNGFTLIEMLIVLFIITVLILIAIPNITKHFQSVDDKGCNAYVKMVQGQVEAYKIDKGIYPTTIEVLEAEHYLKEGSKEKSCKAYEVTIEQGEVKSNAPQ